MTQSNLPKFLIQVDLDKDYIEYVFEQPLSQDEIDQVTEELTCNEDEHITVQWSTDSIARIY